MSLSLLISCLISFLGAGKSILLSKNIAKKKIRTNRIILITRFLYVLGLILDPSCIIAKLYLNSKIKT